MVILAPDFKWLTPIMSKVKKLRLILGSETVSTVNYLE